MKPRRVLVFSLLYGPFWGGAELAVKEITDRINPKEMTFDLIALRADASLPKIEKIGNITVHRVGPAKRGMTHAALMRFPWYLIKALFPVLAAVHAKKLARENRYDVMWSLMTYMGFPAVLSRMLGVRIPFVLTLQDGDTVEHITKRARIRLVGPLLKKVFRDAKEVHVISNYLGAFAKHMGYPGEPIRIPNGVAVARFTDSDAGEVKRITAQFHKKDGELFLITTSRLVEKNGIGDVIDALPKLPNVRFLVLGDGHLRSSLEERAKNLGVSERVVFLGHVTPENIPTYLHASDIFIRPSLSEGLGSSFLEAMAAGLPVVATPVGGIPDFLFDVKTHGKRATGMFCNPHDPESIVSAVTHLTHDQEIRECISQNAKKLVLQQYDWNAISVDIKKILDA